MVIGISCLLMLVGCANANTPSSVARKFYEALEKNDSKALGQYATAETTQLMAMFGEKIQETLKTNGKITQTTETIDGDTAVVTITFENGDTTDLDLIKIDGKWKVAITK
jgi:hypothetical protein